jgi:hypothetical protein
VGFPLKRLHVYKPLPATSSFEELDPNLNADLDFWKKFPSSGTFSRLLPVGHRLKLSRYVVFNDCL